MIKFKPKKFLLLLAVLLGSFGLFGKPISANELNFNVTPNLPENQISVGGGFNLLMSPGATQTLTVTLNNSTDKAVVVENSIASATTNINGVVDYSPNDIKPDKSLKYNIVDLAKMPKETSIPSGSSVKVEIQVTMPKEGFQGIIAGGITFQEKETEESKQSSGENGLSIQNKYRYRLGLLIQQDKTKVAPDLVLNDVAAGQVNYRNVINANLQNPKMGYLNQMYASASIKGLTDTSLSYSGSKEMMQMAPNTNFDYPVALGDGKALKAGKYRLSMTVYGQKNENGKYSMTDAQGKIQKFDYKWEFTRDFEITGEQAAELNKKDVTIKPDYSWVIWAIIGGILVLLALLLFFILWKRRKKDDEEEEEGEKAALQAELDALKAQLNADEPQADESADDKKD